MTLNQVVTGYGEIGRTEIGGNQEERETVGKSRVSAIWSFPKISQKFHKNAVFFPKTIFGKNLGKIWEKQRKDVRYEKSKL